MKQIASRTRQYPTAAFFGLTILLSVGVGAITDAIYKSLFRFNFAREKTLLADCQIR